MKMKEELITPENLSIDLLKSTFEAAYMDVRLEEDSDLIVKEDVNVRIRIDEKRKNRIRFLTIFGFKDGVAKIDKLECVNNINNDYIMLCASCIDNDLLIFRHDILLFEGVTKKDLVLSVKKFATIPHDAVNEYGTDIVE